MGSKFIFLIDRLYIKNGNKIENKSKEEKPEIFILPKIKKLLKYECKIQLAAVI